MLTLRGGAGDDTIAVLNGFADIRGGSGADTFLLEYDRPAIDDQTAPAFPLERGFPGIGDVVIRDFDLNEDRLFIVLPPVGSENVQLESIARVGNDTVISLRVDIAPYFEFPDGTTFRSTITVQNVDLVDGVEMASDAERLVLSVNAPPVPPKLPTIAF